MNVLGTLVVLALGVTLGSSLTAEDYHQKYIKAMNDGMKCQPGYKTLSPKIVAASEKCAKEKEMASYLCFLTCMYREYEYVKKGKDNELDYAIADAVTMESFDLTTQPGRDSYWTIALNRYFCGRDYMVTGKAHFAMKYNDADACARATPFFKCQGDSLFCHSEKFSFTEDK